MMQIKNATYPDVHSWSNFQILDENSLSDRNVMFFYHINNNWKEYIKTISEWKRISPRFCQENFQGTLCRGFFFENSTKECSNTLSDFFNKFTKKYVRHFSEILPMTSPEIPPRILQQIPREILTRILKGTLPGLLLLFFQRMAHFFQKLLQWFLYSYFSRNLCCKIPPRNIHFFFQTLFQPFSSCFKDFTDIFQVFLYGILQGFHRELHLEFLQSSTRDSSVSSFRVPWKDFFEDFTNNLCRYFPQIPPRIHA